MDSYREMSNCTAFESQEEEDADLRRGPWTVEEDRLLVAYITNHGEGRWNSLARSAGLKRTGKSCRLRWLNYLRPDVRRGNMLPEEQLLILELHSRWSKIAQHLPGRTDNEIKNYWRTRVQKHAKQMQCDVNSQQFRDAMKYLWMPRLMEQIHAARSSDFAAQTGSSHSSSLSSSPESPNIGHNGLRQVTQPADIHMNQYPTVCESSYITTTPSDSTSGISDSADYYCLPEFAPAAELTQANCTDYNQGSSYAYSNQTSSYLHEDQLNIQPEMNNWIDTDSYGGGDFSENLWSSEDVWFLQQQLCNTF